MWAQALVSVYYYHHLTQWTSKKAHHFTILRKSGVVTEYYIRTKIYFS